MKSNRFTRWFWLQIWNASEWSGIGLGKFAPFVFDGFMGQKGTPVDSLGRPLKK